MEYPLRGVLHGYLRHLLFFTAGLEPRGPRWVFSEEAGKPLEAVGGSVAPENSQDA